MTFFSSRLLGAVFNNFWQSKQKIELGKSASKGSTWLVHSCSFLSLLSLAVEETVHFVLTHCVYSWKSRKYADINTSVAGFTWEVLLLQEARAR